MPFCAKDEAWIPQHGLQGPSCFRWWLLFSLMLCVCSHLGLFVHPSQYHSNMRSTLYLVHLVSCSFSISAIRWELTEKPFLTSSLQPRQGFIFPPPQYTHSTRHSQTSLKATPPVAVWQEICHFHFYILRIATLDPCRCQMSICRVSEPMRRQRMIFKVYIGYSSEKPSKNYYPAKVTWSLVFKIRCRKHINFVSFDTEREIKSSTSSTINPDLLVIQWMMLAHLRYLWNIFTLAHNLFGNS